MKKNFKFLFSLFLCFIFIILVSKIYAYSPEIVPNKIKIGETITLKLEPQKEISGEYTYEYIAKEWSTSSKGIIEITSNKETAKVKGIHKGTATIKVKCTYNVYTTGSEKEVMGTYGPEIKKNYLYSTETTFERKIEVSNETISDDYNNMYKKQPEKDWEAKEIKYFILSDEQNNDSKALKKLAKENKDIIQTWYDTVTKYISTDYNHYNQQNQYGSTKSKLLEIINAYNNNTSVDDAIDVVDTSGAANVVQNSIDRILLEVGVDPGNERTDVEFTDVLTDIGSYIPTDEASDGRLEGKVSIILTVITNIGMVLAILMVAIIGIKYMLGSVEEKAEYKKDMIPYLVGACLLFGITVIVKVLQQFGQSINNI